MPPSLALFLCTGFVLVLLWLERQQTRNLSMAVWLPTIWVMSCASKQLSYWFGTGMHGPDMSVESGNPLDRLFLTGCIGVGLMILARRGVSWQSIKKDNLWLVILFAYALLSIAWSEFTFVSIKRYIRLCGSVVMALVIMSEPSPRRALESVFRRSAFVLIPFSLMLIKYFPHLGVMFGRWSGERMWVGVAWQKNSLGVLCSVSAFFLFWRVMRAWLDSKQPAEKRMIYADLGVLAMALFLLKGPGKGAYSATSVAVFMVGGMTLLALYWMQKMKLPIKLNLLRILVIPFFLYGIGAPFGFAEAGSSVLELLGRDATFTDRDQIWNDLIPIVARNPALGVGYGGFWVRTGEFDVNEAHNGYLDLMLELGSIGAVLLFLFVLSMCRAVHQALSGDFWWASFGFAFLLIVVLHNTTEASFLKSSDFLWTITLFLALLMPRLRKRSRPLKMPHRHPEVDVKKMPLPRGPGIVSFHTPV